MKKTLLLIIALMLALTINASTGQSQTFEGSLTVTTQYLDGYNNVSLKWEDNTLSNDNYAYIITSGNSENEDNHIVKGYTTGNSFAIYKNPTLPNISPRYTVYKLDFNQDVELADIIPNNDGNQFRVALTWSQIKELLKKKSNNIWKISRNNIPTSMK